MNRWPQNTQLHSTFLIFKDENSDQKGTSSKKKKKKSPFFFWPFYTACRILVPWPRIKTVPPAVEAWSPNHQTTREVPKNIYLKPMSNILCNTLAEFSLKSRVRRVLMLFGSSNQCKTHEAEKKYNCLEKNQNCHYLQII